MGLRALKTPPRRPKANSLSERVIGTLHREYFDFLIPLTEYQPRDVLKEWVTHYNRGRPHASIWPGIPDPPQSSLSHYNNIVTVLQATLWLWLTLSWVDYVTNIDW